MLIKFTPSGIFCEQAGIYIDPWKPVHQAVITHAHSDHARWGMKNYLAHKDSEPILRLRLGEKISLQTVGYNEPVFINGVKLSFHPAGHVPGSAQVRLEYKGEVNVVSGDYKTEYDGLSTAFEPVKCNVFVTESTFGLPIYRWQSQREIFDEINAWWKQNQAEGFTSVLYGYSLGKAQRIIHNVDHNIGRIFTHGGVESTNRAFRRFDIDIHETTLVNSDVHKDEYKGNLVIAPPSAMNSTWLKRFLPYREAVCSGWMALRGARRRRNVAKGFALSDHADWPGLNDAVAATGAEKVFVTHGYSDIFAQWLREQGLDAEPITTEFGGDEVDETTAENTAEALSDTASQSTEPESGSDESVH
ncbi:MAG TPA: ligase-associated DNA damage response exonuclease [Chitinophagales bacterium]|nr:ligase-associated DNA damage response exonuclease [Chitinophagales bacterium]